MIQAGRFHGFVLDFVAMRNEEEQEKTLWDFWLHKVFDKSYTDFKNSVNTSDKDTDVPTQDEIMNTVSASFDMLRGFNPDGGASDARIIRDNGDNGDRHDRNASSD